MSLLALVVSASCASGIPCNYDGDGLSPAFIVGGVIFFMVLVVVLNRLKVGNP